MGIMKKLGLHVLDSMTEGVTTGVKITCDEGVDTEKATGVLRLAAGLFIGSTKAAYNMVSPTRVIANLGSSEGELESRIDRYTE